MITHNVGVQLLLDGWTLGLLTAVLAWLLGGAVDDWQARKRRKTATVVEPTQAPPTGSPIAVLQRGQARLRLPSEERQEVVASLRQSGMSYPAIAAATGVSVGTAHADAKAFSSESLPNRTQGTDGKTYAASRPAPGPNTWVEPQADDGEGRP